MASNSENIVIDPVSSLLSPPRSKIPLSNTVHAFFTPRRPLDSISSSTSNSRARIHLLSPDESPSRRCKRPRLDSSPLAPKCAQLPPPPPPVEPEQPLPQPRQYIRPTSNTRMLMRSLGGYSTRGSGGSYVHCADWSSEVTGLYTRPEDSLPINKKDGTSTLPFCAVACNRNSLVAVGDESGLVRLVESAKDEEPGFSEAFLTLNCHDNAVFDVSWTPDDRQLATGGGDQTSRIWDITTQTQVFVLRNHQNTIKQVAYNPHNPSILATSARDGLLNIWDLRVSGFRIQDGDNTVTILEPVRTFEVGGRGVSVTAAVWTEEHQVATATQNDAVVRLYDLKSSYSRRTKPGPVVMSKLPSHHRNRRLFGLNCLTLSPDGQRIYAVCKDNNIYAYATNHLSQGPIHAYSHSRLHANTFFIKSAISRDGRILATGSSDSAPIVFPTDEKYFDEDLYRDFRVQPEPGTAPTDLMIGQGVALVRGHEKEVTDVAWTTGGDMVALSDEGRARCWRVGETGEEAGDLRSGGEDEGRRWMWGWAEK